MGDPDSEADITEARKGDHLRIVAEEKVEWGGTWLDYVRLIHKSLPEMDLEDTDTGTTFLGREYALPLNISGMTGGTEQAKKVNKGLAEAAQKAGISMGVGSQRAMIEDPSLTETFYVRDVAPDVFLFGNIGIVQVKEYSPSEIHDALNAIEADALAVHLNPAQEIFQNEGDWNFSDCVHSLTELCDELDCPVVAKEVGHGLSRDTAEHLVEAGVDVLDVQGSGGTSWAYIDSLRSGKDCTYFKEWGVPTGASILEVADLGLPVIGSGGVRSGADVAKCIAMGAGLSGMALPMFRAVNKGGPEEVMELIEKVRDELRYAMFLTGSYTVEELNDVEYVLGGPLSDWAGQRAEDDQTTGK